MYRRSYEPKIWVKSAVDIICLVEILPNYFLSPLSCGNLLTIFADYINILTCVAKVTLSFDVFHIKEIKWQCFEMRLAYS